MQCSIAMVVEAAPIDLNQKPKFVQTFKEKDKFDKRTLATLSSSGSGTHSGTSYIFPKKFMTFPFFILSISLKVMPQIVSSH